MESDLSLIEISGEDDSLLQQIPSDDVSNNYFSCSPLQLLRSKRSADSSHITQLGGMKGSGPAQKPRFSSPRDNSNKENTNANKSEVPKFGVEPQQMKRRKKGGGFNLRKSLAWNRAFFTEEGVLDPLELSLLSGTFNKPSGNMSVIHEEGGNSLLGDSDCTSDSVDLQAVEENLFKELPASTPNKGKKIGGGLLSKHDSSARDNVASASVSARKVLSAHGVNRSGSKRGGCPRPLASSSQKRPANASTTKAAMKESKPPKIPVPKPDPGLIPTTPKSATLGARHSNRNQIAQRAVNVPKSIGLKGSSNSTRSAQYNAKAGPDCKSISSKTSVQPSRRNMVRNMANSLLVKPSSNNLRPPLVTKPNNGFEVIPDLVLPATGTQGSNGCEKSSKVAVTCPQNPECIGGNTQYTQPQATKPTGLRMPSPSLGFFHLSKASAPQSSLQRSTQSCNIPNLRKLGATNPVCDLRPPRAPGKLLKVVNDVTITGNIRGLNSSRECSVPSPGNSVLHENMKLNLEVNDLQKVEVKVPHELKSSEPINNQQRLHKILHDYDEQFQEHAEPYKVEKISCKGYTELQMNDNKLLPESASHDQLKKDSDHEMVADVCTKSVDSSGNELENPHFSSQFCSGVQVKGVSQTDDMIEHQQVEDRQYNLSVDHDVFSESQSRDAISYSNRGLHRDWLRSMDDVNDWLRSMHDVNEQFREQPELIKPCLGEADRVSEVENQRLQTNDGILFQETRASEYSQKYDGTDVSLKIRGRSGSELESSHGRSQFKDIEQLNERAVGVDVVIIKSDVADAQLQSSDCNLSVESYNSNLSTSVVHNQCLMVDGVNEHSREQPELQNPRLVEGVLQDCHGLCLNGSVMQVEGVSGTNDSIEKQYVEDNQYNLSVKDHGAISESNSGDAISNNPGTLIVHNNWVSGMHNGNEQSREHSELTKPSTCEADQISHEENQKLQAEDGILIEESRSFEEFHKYDSGNIADVCPKVQGSSESESENSDGSSQLKYIDQASEGAAGVYNMTEKSYVGDAQVQSLDDPTLAVHYKCLMFVDDVNKQSGRQNPCCSSEDSQEENFLDSVEVVVSEQKDSGGSESKHSGVLSWAPPAMQDDVGVDVEIMAECPHVEDARSSSVEIEPFVENQVHSIDTELRHDIKLSDQANLEYDAFLKMSKDQIMGAVVTTRNFEAFCCLGEKSVQTLSNGITLQGIGGVHQLKNDTLPKEAECQSSANDPHEEIQKLEGNNGSSGETQKGDSGNIEDSLKVRGSSGSELESSHGLPQRKYTEKTNEGASGVDSMTEKSHVGYAQVQSLVRNVVTESSNCNLKSSEMHNQYIMVDDVNEQSSEDPGKSSSAICSLRGGSGLSGESGQPSSNQSIQQGIGINRLKSKTLFEDAETEIFQNSNSPKGEVLHESDNAMSLTADKDATMPIKKSGNDVKQDAPVIKPPLNVVPFSDEWLAAIEAAGEDILTRKTGAVQNSPPDKSIPEPNPWSPVKRKNIEVGPFDCTKYTNVQPSNSH